MCLSRVRYLRDMSHFETCPSPLFFVEIEFGVFHSHGGTPIAGCFISIYFKEHPNLKWMMTWGTPIYGNPQIIELE